MNIWNETPEINESIPLPFAFTISITLGEILEEVLASLETTTKKLSCIDAAAKIGETIEKSIYKIYSGEEILLPDDECTLEDRVERLLDASHSAPYSEEGYKYIDLSSLLIYQYEIICELYEKKQYDKIFEITEAIVIVRGQLLHSFSNSYRERSEEQDASRKSRKLALIKHAPMNKRKAELLSEWDKSFEGYDSRADFCRIISKRENLIYRTLYDWITKHEKNKNVNTVCAAD